MHLVACIVVFARPNSVVMLTFLRQTVENFQTTGAIAPSSRRLGRMLAQPLGERASDSPAEFLEAGPGTGALTVEIVRHLRPHDRLVLAELNDKFVEHLRQRLAHDPELSRHAHQVEIFHGPVQEMLGEDRFDHIVCGLPFNNFPPQLVQDIFTTFERLAKPGATVNWFEYMGVRKVRTPLTFGETRKRLTEVNATIQRLQEGRQAVRQPCFLNCPPAWARRIRLP